MKFSYNPEVSLGNLLQLVGMLTSVGAAYFALVTTDVRHEAKLKELSDGQVRIESTQKEYVTEIRSDIKEINRNLSNIVINDALSRNKR